MTNPVRDEKLSSMLRNYAADIRDHLAAAEHDAERELLVNRFLATVAGSTGVALSLQRKHDALAATMLAVAVRLWTRAPEARA